MHTIKYMYLNYKSYFIPFDPLCLYENVVTLIMSVSLCLVQICFLTTGNYMKQECK